MARLLAMIEPAVHWTAPRLAEGSVQGVLIIALVWAICRCGRGLRPGVRTALWWLASLRLVLSFLPLPALALPVLPAVPVANHAAVQPEPDQDLVSLPLAAEPSPELTAPVLPAYGGATDAGPAARPAASNNWLDAILGIWFIVVAAHVLRVVVAHRCLARLMAHATPVSDAAMADVRALASRLGLRHTPMVAVTDGVASPQVAGVWRPTVLLPEGFASRVTPDEWRMALGHELMHLRRRDLLLGWVPAIAERLFFFHPLAHLASEQYLLAREAACDAAVVHALNVEAHDYGRMLVRLGVSRATPGFAVSGASPTSSLLRRRLEMLQHVTTSTGTSRAYWILLAAALVVIPFHLTARAAETSRVEAPPPVVVAAPEQPLVTSSLATIERIETAASPSDTRAVRKTSQVDAAPRAAAAAPPAQTQTPTAADSEPLEDLLKQLKASARAGDTSDQQPLAADLARLQEQLRAAIEAQVANAKHQLSQIDWSELEKQLAEARSSIPAIVSAATQAAATAAEQVQRAAQQEELKALSAQLDALKKNLEALQANPANRATSDATRELKIQLKTLEARMKALEAAQRGVARGVNRNYPTEQFLASQVEATKARIQALEAQRRALPPNSTTSNDQIDEQLKAANLMLQQLQTRQQAAIAARSAASDSAGQGLPPSPPNLQATVAREQANVDRQKRAVEEAQRRLAEAEARLRESQDRLKQQNPQNPPR
jgi:bla regulator protein BlaR1